MLLFSSEQALTVTLSAISTSFKTLTPHPSHTMVADFKSPFNLIKSKKKAARFQAAFNFS